MSRTRQKLGRFGEDLAAEALQSKGYVMVDRNYRCSTGELDIAATCGDIWVFVEVRTRRGQAFGTPEESITIMKKAHLLSAAQVYLQDKSLVDVDWRIDVVAVELDKNGRLLRIDVLENAVNAL
jgi:putative endonuclease